eukprot:CAMPEP_0201572086 /NCGR_PEP_ID=MMETSP0190_2-20130828/15134_1 /ASSEMBLY_ACC=CAM_ASM_000263 /TAXON_ID=37353 /ORGANISM="Rosalina sp." /LENGTH=278 /DNA_ID=CAMNT_0047997401 /DNA_START=469 /DNA_END=1306 /DNA_ORIENTATION=+
MTKSSPLTIKYWAQWGMTVGQFQEWIVRVWQTNKSQKEDLRDIEYHYDIGNDFFEGYLGPTLSGSCAIWTGGKEQTLEEAQNNKWSTIIKKIGIQKHHHVLDVGCGWGYFCNKIVEDTGAKCTGITLSVEQIKFAKEHWKKNLCKNELDPNEKGCVEFIFKDYRKADELYGLEKFDRVSSTGMIEHVGYVRIEEYFESLYRVTKPEAKMLIHGITMPDLFGNIDQHDEVPHVNKQILYQSIYSQVDVFNMSIGGMMQHLNMDLNYYILNIMVNIMPEH